MAARKPMTFQQALMASFNPVANGPVGQRASHEAMLRYLPQIQALLMLRQQTAQTGRQNVQAVRRGGYAAAGGIGGVRSSFTQQLADTQAPTSEAAAHLGLTRDAVAGDLAKMQAQQYAGVSAGTAQARRATQNDQASIVQQLLGAAQQGSLYNTSEYDSLANDAHKAAQARKQAAATLTAGLLKAGFDAQGNPIPGIFNRLHPPKINQWGRTDAQWAALTDAQRRQIKKANTPAGSSGGKAAPGTAGAASQSDYNQFNQTLSKARSVMSQYKQLHPHATVRQLATYIQQGLPGDSIVVPVKYTDPKTGKQVIAKNADGSVKTRTKTLAAIPAVDNAAAAYAAAELAMYGGVSEHTIKLLHGLGLRISTLKIPKYHAPKVGPSQGALGVTVGPDGRKT